MRRAILLASLSALLLAGLALREEVRAGEGPSEEEVAWRNRRPELSILLAGGQRGHLVPCGCTTPRTGGLLRLAALVERLRLRPREQAAGFAGISVGWSMAGRGEEQEETKATLYRAFLGEMGFSALLLGVPDLYVRAMAQPFESGEGPGTSRLDVPVPPLNVRLLPGSPASATPPFADIQVGALAIRAFTVVDPEMAQRLQAAGIAEGFVGTASALQALSPKPDVLWIVGAHVSGTQMEELKSGIRRLGPSVIVDLSGAHGTASAQGVAVGGEPLVVSLREFGTSVAVLDLDRREGEPTWTAEVRTLPLGEAMDAWKSPLRDRLRDETWARYRQEVKERGFLKGFSNTFSDPGGLKYVGSASCAGCHPGIYEEWSGSRHAVALYSLKDQDAHHDPECVRCHVVGFERMEDDRWVRTSSAFLDPERTQHLGGVGCESCHGPGSGHVARPSNRTLWEPGKPNRRVPGLDGCARCHDAENSHGFAAGYEKTHLPRVDHRSVPSDRRTVERKR